jgi:hypothetical protein
MDFETWPSIDTSLWSAGTPEATKEQSEKQKESYKKAQAQLQKAQKDEWKAQKDNSVLFDILLRFIQNPYYNELIPIVTDLLSFGLPSRYILALTALVYPESALHMLTSLGKRESIHTLLNIHRHESVIEFNDAHIDPTIRAWMTEWISAFHLYLTHEDSSVISLHILKDKVESSLFQKVLDAFSYFLIFFFRSRNISISEKKAHSYTWFILTEILDIVNERIRVSDSDFRLSSDDPDFFGLSPQDS